RSRRGGSSIRIGRGLEAEGRGRRTPPDGTEPGVGRATRHGGGRRSSEEPAMSAQGPIITVARWQLSVEGVESVLPLLADLRRRTLAEPGCQGYDVFRSVETPGELLLVERYRDDAALQAHRTSKHYQELVVQRILPLISARKVELLRAIEPA